MKDTPEWAKGEVVRRNAKDLQKVAKGSLGYIDNRKAWDRPNVPQGRKVKDQIVLRQWDKEAEVTLEMYRKFGKEAMPAKSLLTALGPYIISTEATIKLDAPISNTGTYHNIWRVRRLYIGHPVWLMLGTIK